MKLFGVSFELSGVLYLYRDSVTVLAKKCDNSYSNGIPGSIPRAEQRLASVHASTHEPD